MENFSTNNIKMLENFYNKIKIEKKNNKIKITLVSSRLEHEYMNTRR